MNYRNKLRNTLKVSLVGLSLYGLINLSLIPEIFSEKIRDKEHLQKVIQEEAKKLELKDEKIIGFVSDRKNILSSLVMPAESFTDSYCNGIIINHSLGMRRGIVRHELAHIANKDTIMGTGLKCPNYWIYQEPLANLYGGFNIRVSGEKLNSILGKDNSSKINYRSIKND